LLRGQRELFDRLGLDGAHQPAKRGARQDRVASGQDREARVVEGPEVKDAPVAKRRAEEQRKHQAPRLPSLPSTLAKVRWRWRSGRARRATGGRRPRSGCAPSKRARLLRL
jgi:hypothetical protein